MSTKQPFQDSIAHVITERKKSNPAYSLRSFAQSIGVTPAHLSMIMNREKFPTPELVERIGTAIEVGVQTIQVWQKEIRDQKKSFFFNGHAEPEDGEANKWYFDAIIELVRTTHFQSSHKFIAQELGLELQQVIDAVEVLERKEILSTRTSPWSVTESARRLISANRSSPEKRQIQKDLLEVAIGAIDEVNTEKRAIRSATMSVHSERIAEAKEMISKFNRELQEFLTKGGPGDKVYHLTIGLFPNLSKDDDE